MKAIRRLALRDLRFNKTRAVFATILISLPVMAALVIGSMISQQSSSWMLDQFRDVPNIQAAAKVSCDCEVRQSPDVRATAFLDVPREDGDVVDVVTSIISPNNSVEIRTTGINLMLQKAPEYNYYYSDASRALGNQTAMVEGRAPEAADEVALSAGSRDALGAELGDTIARMSDDGDRSEVTIVGFTESINLVVQEGSVERPTLNVLAANSWGAPEIVITGPDPVTWEQVQWLNLRGITAASVSVTENPPSDDEVAAWLGDDISFGWEETNYVAIATIVILGLIEVVLLISPPFTMAVRRNERALGQLAALGATKRHLRSLMLYQGIILGFFGSIFGLIGFGVFRLVINAQSGAGLAIVLWQYPAAMLLAVALGLIAAIIPAITSSRIDVVAVLTGRESGGSVRSRRSTVGPIILALGLGVLIVASARGSNILLSVGMIVMVLGLIGTAPVCVQLASRLVGRIGLAGKLAGRESMRSLHRTAPGVAAVMIVTIISTLTIAQFATMMTQNYTEENVAGPRGAAWIQFNNAGTGGDDMAILEEEIASFDSMRAVASWTPAYSVTYSDSSITVEIPDGLKCPFDDEKVQSALTNEEYEQALKDTKTDDRCAHYWGDAKQNEALPNMLQSGFPLVDDGTILETLPGVTDVELGKEILDRGGILLADKNAVYNGQVQVQKENYSAEEFVIEAEMTVPGAAVLDLSGPNMIISPALAEEFGLIVYPLGALLEFDSPVTLLESGEFFGTSSDSGKSFVSGVNEVNTAFVISALAAAIISLLVAIGTAVIIVILAGRETRGDFDTIDAVGGKPALRRQVSRATGLIITMAGVIPGLIVGAGLTRVMGELVLGDSLELPVLPLIALGFIIIVLATLIAGIFTPRRRALTRRVD